MNRQAATPAATSIAAPRPIDVPLVVDLDGTLTPTDTLHEGVLQVLRERPAALPGCLLALRQGRARLKQAVGDAGTVAADALPWREDLLEYIRAERARGRRIVLATAADRRMAERVAEHLGLFDHVIASSGTDNRKGAAKLEALRAEVGPRFDYAGDSSADLAVWAGAEGAILVGRGRRLRSRLPSTVTVVAEFGSASGAGWRTWAKALRLHQWLKNGLIWVPLFTGDVQASAGVVMALALAFLAFSVLASATYLVNDLLDLPSDRRHARKRARPMAAGTISIPAALLAAAAGLAACIAICSQLPRSFGLVVLGYWLLTTAYSAFIKRYVLLDVLTLAMLYTSRIVAGAAVLSILLSPWLLAFSAMLFLSLALLKRSSELVLMERSGRPGASGRDYQVGDLPTMTALGSASAMAAIVVFCLFISQPATVARYATAGLLWVSALALSYWLMRLWVKTGRGEMHDDPLVYTLRDAGCRWTLAALVASTLLARFIVLPTP